MQAILICLAALATALCPSHAAAAASLTPWQMKKCQIYRSAWQDLPKIMDVSTLTQQFITLNKEFMASNCLAHTKICPENKAEIDAANLLTVASMNGGTASSFLPFRC